MGGVGGVHLATLARLGVGHFTIADPDCFEVANMNRQYGARVNTIGHRKVDVMAEEVRQINPSSTVRIIREAIGPDTAAYFMEGADLFVDGIDFFAMKMRRRLFQQAASQGIHAITAGPIGFGAAWLVFDPRGMSFDSYFDMRDDQGERDQLIRFIVGLTPALLQRPYIDTRHVRLFSGKTPSVGMACHICSGVVGAEAVRILLNRGHPASVPVYAQFDPYRRRFRQGRLWWGNRGPIQRLKIAWIKRLLAE